ncbi:unnamed protein product [Caenorhabditis brenneri]
MPINYNLQQEITGTALKKILLKFIPHQFIKNVDLTEIGFDNPERLNDGGEGLLQTLMDRATDDIRMYGTAKKLAADLQKHQLFTSSHKYFGMKITEEYPDMAQTYRNQKNEQFICKQDALVLLKSVYSNTFEEPNRLCRSIIMIYFKSCEEKLNGRLEFIRYNEEFFGTFVSPSTEALDHEIEKLRAITPLPIIDEIFYKWKSLLPGMSEKHNNALLDALKTHFEQFPIEGTGSSYSNIQKYWIVAYRCLQHLLTLQNKMASWPELLLPNHSPIVVRLFEDDGKKFAMKSELNQAFGSIDSSFKKWNTEELNGFIPVIYFEEIERDFAHLIPKIHFLAVRIDDPTTNPPKPIMTQSGSFCVYGLLGSTYMLMYLCLVLKVVQKVGREKWHMLIEYLNWHTKEFPLNTLQSFITMEKYEAALQYTIDYFKEFQSVEAKHPIRDWNKEYTLSDLRSDLKSMGLVDLLPGIERNAAFVHEETKKMRKLDKLKSSEMFELVGVCQLAAIAELRSLLEEEQIESTRPPSVKRAAPKNNRSSPVEASLKESKDDSRKVSNEKKPEKGTEETDKMIGLKMQLNYSLQREKDLKIEMKQKESEYELEISRNKRIIEELKEKFEKSKETIQKLSDSKTQLNSKVSELESRLDDERKKTKKSEKAAKQKEAELNRKFNVTESKYKKEISDIKKVIIDLKNVEKKSKETIQMLSDSKNQLIDKVSNLESQLKAEQQKTKKLEQAASAEQSKQRQEISEKERTINELTEVLKQKTSEIEQVESQFEVERVLKNSLEDELANNNEAISELTNYQNHLIGRNGHLESLLEREKQRTQELAQTMSPMLQRLAGGQIDVDLEQEVSEIKNVNSRLQDTNNQLTAQVEQQKMVIKSFFEHFGQVQKTYSSSSCQTTPEEFTSGYTGVKHHLWSLQKIKDSFRKGNQLEQAKKMAEKLSIQQPEMADYELQQYEAQLHHYLQSIEVNIQKMKKTGECTHLDPIPDLPTFSDRFLKEYWKLADNKNSEPEAPPGSIPEDPECLICLIEMNLKEKTTKCEHCRKVMHSECASEWLKRHRSCPHCRRELLDPNEFPPLS